MTVSAAALGLSQHQLTNAEGIIAAVKDRGWPARAAIIAVETALTESGMRILASANVPTSTRYPHDKLSWTADGLGHDHASIGMFQQQTGWAWALLGTSTMGSANGWGTPAELMNPKTSTTKFLDALARIDWRSGTRWAAAQAVQRSAFGDGSNYRQQDLRAIQIVTAVWSGVVLHPPGGDTTASSGHKPLPSTTGKYTVRSGDTLAKIATKYHTTWRKLQTLNNLANPNRIHIGQVLRVPKPATTTTVHLNRIVAKYIVRKGDTLTAICHRYPQAWITPASVQRINGISNPNHLVIGQLLRIGG